MAEFYKNLKILSQDLYKRSASTGVPPGADRGERRAIAGSQRPMGLAALTATGAGGSGLTNLVPPSRWSPSAGSGAGVGFGAENSLTGSASVDGDGGSINSNNVVVGGSATAGYRQLLHAQAQPATGDYFSPESMTERMRTYIRAGGIPQEFVDRYREEVRARRTSGAAAGGAVGGIAGGDAGGGRVPPVAAGGGNAVGTGARIGMDTEGVDSEVKSEF